MIVSMNVSHHFVKICPVLTILRQLSCRGVANFGTRRIVRKKHRQSFKLSSPNLAIRPK